MRTARGCSAFLGVCLVGNIGRIFTKEGWKGGKSFGTNLIDPGGLFTKFEETTPNKKPPAPVDEEAALARETERRRLSTGSRPTVLSGRTAGALSANIGKRTLGGSN